MLVLRAWAGLFGWAVARLVSTQNETLQGAIYGLSLGLCVAFGLSLVDALWNFSPSQFLQIFGFRKKVKNFVERPRNKLIYAKNVRLQ